MIGHKDSKPENYIKLQKHGGSGGECHRWDLAADDRIVQMEVSFNWFTSELQRFRFFTVNGEQRSLGEMKSIFVAANYAYDHYKQFVGFITYEKDDKTSAAGSYDSFCNHLSNDHGSSLELEIEMTNLEAELRESGAEETLKEHFERLEAEASEGASYTEVELHFQAYEKWVVTTGSEMTMESFKEWH